MRVLCIGDSNTYGYDPRTYFGSRYPAEVRWTDRLDGYEVINCGMNGLPVPYDSRPFTDLIRTYSPDLVVVMLGSNDLLEGASAESTAVRMDGFLGVIGTAGARILLIAPPPMRLGDWVQSPDLIRESEKLGKKHLHFFRICGIIYTQSGEREFTDRLN